MCQTSMKQLEFATGIVTILQRVLYIRLRVEVEFHVFLIHHIHVFKRYPVTLFQVTSFHPGVTSFHQRVTSFQSIVCLF